MQKIIYIYSWMHIDDDPFMKPCDEVGDSIKNGFKAAGWEGDGVFQMFWLPPFIDGSMGDTIGSVLLHVKQSNNGESFIAHESTLHFSELMVQNDNQHLPIHVDAEEWNRAIDPWFKERQEAETRQVGEK